MPGPPPATEQAAVEVHGPNVRERLARARAHLRAQVHLPRNRGKRFSEIRSGQPRAQGASRVAVDERDARGRVSHGGPRGVPSRVVRRETRVREGGARVTGGSPPAPVATRPDGLRGRRYDRGGDGAGGHGASSTRKRRSEVTTETFSACVAHLRDTVTSRLPS